MTTASNNYKLSPSDWATVVTLVTRGEKRVREIAEMFGVSPQAISKGLRKRGVVIGSKVGEMQAETEDAASAAHKAKVKAAHATADRYQKYNDAIALLTFKKIMDANNAGGIHTANADVITLKNGMAIISKARAEAWTIQKIEEMLQQDEDLAALNVGEYTPEELEQIRQANEEHYQASMHDVDDLLVDEDDDVFDEDEEEE